MIHVTWQGTLPPLWEVNTVLHSCILCLLSLPFQLCAPPLLSPTTLSSATTFTESISLGNQTEMYSLLLNLLVVVKCMYLGLEQACAICTGYITLTKLGTFACSCTNKGRSMNTFGNQVDYYFTLVRIKATSKQCDILRHPAFEWH